MRGPQEISRQRNLGCLVTLAVFALLFGTYAGGYLWARATHRLVRYSGDYIGGPSGGGLGFTTWELVFAPAAWSEEKVRRNVPGLSDPGV